MPSPQISKKKLKAIVFTDIADFTKLSAQDEQKALDLLHKQNEILKPIVEKHMYPFRTYGTKRVNLLRETFC